MTSGGGLLLVLVAGSPPEAVSPELELAANLFCQDGWEDVVVGEEPPDTAGERDDGEDAGTRLPLVLTPGTALSMLLSRC